jgi:heme/copper-type cytochrome/quinol oxidase subunit 2
MKTIVRWINWWLVLLSFLAFLCVEGALVYFALRYFGVVR